MSNSSKSTTDHSTIKQWAEQRNGKPVIVEGTEGNQEGAGLLRIDFPGYAEDNLKEISWEDFFKTFDQKKLAMVYQEKTEDGKQSRFNKFVDRSSVEG